MQPHSPEVTNILVCGVGGQGVMTAAEILVQTAILLGFDGKKTEIAGMAQRGGVAISHVRFGARVLSPSIPAGEADILIAFEPAEAMRWIAHLRPEGIAMVNTKRLCPPIVSCGVFEYPENPVDAMRAKGYRVHDLDAGAIAAGLGELRLVNTVLLGAIADHLPFAPDFLRQQVTARFHARKPELAELNQRAFDAGRKAVAAVVQETVSG